MRVLSLFSGGGLGDYGLMLAGMEIVGQVEIDDYCQKILKLRWPDVPKWKDIRDVTGEEIKEKCGTIDLISGGFPCQPFSVAGKQRGKEDDRHLWPEMFRVITQVKPRYVLAENVFGLVRLGLDEVLHDLEAEGYATRTIVFPAHAVGAPHRRDRVWIVGYSQHNGRTPTEKREGVKVRNGSSEEGKGTTGESEGSNHVANARCKLRQGGEKRGNNEKENGKGDADKPQRSSSTSSSMANANPIGSQVGWADNDKKGRQGQKQRPSGLCDVFAEWWSIEPSVGRVAHGVSNRVDRLKLLGNGQVVQVVQWIGERIMEFDNQKD